MLDAWLFIAEDSVEAADRYSIRSPIAAGCHEMKNQAPINSKLRGSDLVSLRVHDVTHGNHVVSRAMVVQRKTQRPVQFELTEPTRTDVAAWIAKAGLRSEDFLFPSRLNDVPHLSTRQYARIVEH